MVTRVPTGPLVELKELMNGCGTKIKPVILAVPPGVVKLISPDAPAPTTATIAVEDTTVNTCTDVPPRVIANVPMKFVPVIVIVAPEPTAVGLKEMMVGGGIKLNPAMEAEPPGVVIPMAPDEPLPTTASRVVDETTVKAATGVPPNVTIDVPVKFVPVMLI